MGALKKGPTFDEYRAHVGKKYFDQFVGPQPVDLFDYSVRYWTPPKAMRYWAFLIPKDDGSMDCPLRVNDDGFVYVRHLRIRDGHVEQYWRILFELLEEEPNFDRMFTRYQHFVVDRADKWRAQYERRLKKRDEMRDDVQRTQTSLKQMTRADRRSADV
ncbi:MAG: hypothetical protein F9K34_02725 [Albidovulum sp.]|uniref:hypothetical protein n=1 Tax=Albidovulum sp. TaxID=1872424 RepID=UPI00132AEE45|nr:hypothetical protein [Defluviimonas sp.]KAB2886288.1 MAG: hypothetical protein F9K34_02725 [Defluviimonas sp.]